LTDFRVNLLLPRSVADLEIFLPDPQIRESELPILIWILSGNFVAIEKKVVGK
jgi:hypothetical protein